MQNPSLILFAVVVFLMVYLFVYIINYNNRINRQQQQKQAATPQFYLVPQAYPPQRQASKGPIKTLSTVMMLLFTAAVIYLFQVYDGKPLDFQKTHSVSVESGLDLYEDIYTSSSMHNASTNLLQVEVSQAAQQLHKGSKIIGQIFSQQAATIHQPLVYKNKWAIQLVAKETSTQWMDAFKAGIQAYCQNGRYLMESTTEIENGVELYRFYIGPFPNKEAAQLLIRELEHLSSDARVINLNEVPDIRPYTSA
ncbi:MAG: hypothetical protein MI974_10840 [Chitinophagales bacterium]|nr:hypothetical protein [Chitinophagales bacterium]